MTLNGRTVTELGTRALPTDRVVVDGRPLPVRPDLVYLMLHKPVGVVTTLSDPEERETVAHFLPRRLGRVFPVGRLDVQSSGLLLLTNDGALAARITHPRYHVPRVYRVKVAGTPDEKALGRMRRGVRLEDGPTGPAEVVVERALPSKTWLRVTVHEGRNRLVRRLCEAIGHPAEKLQRIAIGPLDLGKLAPGTCRTLTHDELRRLRAAAGVARPRPRARHAAPRRRAR